MRAVRQKDLLATGMVLLGVWSGMLIAGSPQTQQTDDLPPTPPAAVQETQSTSRVSGATAEGSLGTVGPNYVIGPEDVLEIDVFNVPELSSKREGGSGGGVRVANDGTISLPLLGRVQAAGFTVQQLAEHLQAKWGETYLQNPQVSVFVKEFQAKPVSVIGAVERPGLYYLTGQRNLVEVLSMAGGLAKRGGTAAGRTVMVTRKSVFKELPSVEGLRALAPDRIEINLQKLLYAQEPVLNIEIMPLDTISVSRADIVYVVGAVKRAGGFVLEDRERVTVLQALALAEGLEGTAARGSARIIRRGDGGSRTEIPVNLGKILKGQSNDVELAANDILFVPDSTGKLAGRRGADAAVGIVTGLIIWRR
jgi:polysaccharide biosynthesis/export protein